MSTLYIISTPIGNLEDITLRALRILSEIDVLASEDTRVTRNIFTRHNINPPSKIISYQEHNEIEAGKKILRFLEEGLSVGLCTDGGSPGVSDPGYRIISEALDQGFQVETIPGASAVITALLASGLSTSSFTFKGFPPRKSGARQRFLEMEAEQPHTLIFYESPHRIVKTLTAALSVYGNRKAAVCAELTKKFEKVHRGYLNEIIEKLEPVKVRGEITLVIAGSNPKFLKE